MITTEEKLGDVVYVVKKLGFKYKIFYIKNEDEVNKELPPPDTIYIYVIKK